MTKNINDFVSESLMNGGKLLTRQKVVKATNKTAILDNTLIIMPEGKEPLVYRTPNGSYIDKITETDGMNQIYEILVTPLYMVKLYLNPDEVSSPIVIVVADKEVLEQIGAKIPVNQDLLSDYTIQQYIKKYTDYEVILRLLKRRMK